MSDRIQIDTPVQQALSANEILIRNKLRAGDTPEHIALVMRIPYPDVIYAVSSIRSKGHKIEEETEMAWTEEAKQTLVRMKSAGAKNLEIAKEVGHTPNQVNVMWHYLRKNQPDQPQQNTDPTPEVVPEPLRLSGDVPDIVINAAREKLKQLQDLRDTHIRLAGMLDDDITALDQFLNAAG